MLRDRTRAVTVPRITKEPPWQEKVLRAQKTKARANDTLRLMESKPCGAGQPKRGRPKVLRRTREDGA